MRKPAFPVELSYYQLSLFSFLRDSHPPLATDTAFIAARGDAAAEAYSAAVKSGEPHERAGEIANEILYTGLHFSPYRTLVHILWNEFASDIDPALAEGVAIELLPKLNNVFGHYHFSDDFLDTPEYEAFYTELTGAVQILFEDGQL